MSETSAIDKMTKPLSLEEWLLFKQVELDVDGPSKERRYGHAAAELTRLRTLIDGLIKAVEPFAVFETGRAEVTPEEDGSDWIAYRLNQQRGGEFVIIRVSDSRALLEAYLKAKGE